MSFAKATLVQRVRNLLNDRPWETTSTTTGTGTPVAVPDGTKWAAGDIGEWTYTGTVGGELFLVQSVSGNNLTVVRGYGGTTAEAHTSGDRVTKNPTFYYRDIVEALDETLNGLWPTVWKVVSQDVTPDSTKNWIDSGLSGSEITDVMDLSAVGQVHGSNSDLWGEYGPGHQKRVRFRRNLPTATWTSTIAVRFPDGYYHGTNAVTFRWRARITDVVSGSNYSDISDGKLIEPIIWLAAARLLDSREITGLNFPAEEGFPGLGSHVNVAAVYRDQAFSMLQAYRRDLEETVPRMKNQVW